MKGREAEREAYLFYCYWLTAVIYLFIYFYLFLYLYSYVFRYSFICLLFSRIVEQGH